MKTKKILRFYFSAESLERAFDNLIINNACAWNLSGLAAAEKLCSIVGEKICLERLWAYLDKVMATFSESEREILSGYSARYPVFKGDDKALKRTVIKFTRRAHRISDFGEETGVLKKYYCLLQG